MRVVELSGGVGGSRLAKGLAALPEVDLTVVVNVGDDTRLHGLHVSPDLDTVVYALAGIEGPMGWGRADESFTFNEELATFGVDNTFRLGDKDLALKVFRTSLLDHGESLSTVTEKVTRSLGVDSEVIPVTDDPLRTMVRLADGWVEFREYFVSRGHRDRVLELRFDGSEAARPAPGVLEAVGAADRVVIGPSNPPLSIWPILAVPGLRDAIASHPDVLAVSPLVEGKAVKGPVVEVMSSLGLPDGDAGVAAAYAGLLERLVVHATSDDPAGGDHEVIRADTLIPDLGSARRLATELLSL